ncbi:winged helix-turn-helix domain-containing protein [Sphingomicrobium clamense]|uniref:Winged helix-turn-helix domain-containing protein n=1 Tax=Sphingomicrobium clamense TaxID=2851013 RepID=A0ABS6V741_9SPHN|nr:winged helix-turn-helix domain-containing protein [Sphingomicrobium sp. B8]MBW0145394.1 winged helix-turn-helix domain-containing protein [Sphingomicrobium sp. B8]
MDGITAIDLAHESAFDAGSVRIDPAHRKIVVEGRGEAILEPKIMQVLVALARHPGRIFSRDDLIEACWDGVIVGDDAINRVISQIRKKLREVGADDVSVQTVTKVGYQLDIQPSENVRPEGRTRTLIVAGIALLILFVTAGWMTGWFGANGDREVSISPTPVTILPVETATPEDDALAAGLRSTLSANLNSTGRVRVPALESAADLERFGLGPREIGERLAQRYVIQLALDVDGGQVEARMRKHGIEEGRVVSERTIRRPFGNLELLQSDLAQAIVETIPVATVGDSKTSRVRNALSGEDEARLLMAIGRMRTGTYDGLSSAENLLRQLASRHPENGAVLAMLSITISELLAIDPDRPAGKFYDKEALALARRARELAPDLADAHFAEPVARGPVVRCCRMSSGLPSLTP